MPKTLALILTLLPLAASAASLALDIKPGDFDEHCLRIDAGKSIRYRFTASTPVDFNIHHHRGKEVLYPVKRDGIAREQGEFRAPATADYCLMWTNRTKSPARIDGEVDR